MKRKKVAVVLLNLGGPASLSHVRSFLFRLFSDRKIIDLPQPFRFFLATLISSFRYKKSQKLYEKTLGRSPLLKETYQQAMCLEKALNETSEALLYKVFVSMRYSSPSAKESVKKVQAFDADQVILCSLYPQFSTTTVESSVDDWYSQARDHGLHVPTTTLCCYPQSACIADYFAQQIAQQIDRKMDPKDILLLFSAHSLPAGLVKKRQDPYPQHVLRSAQQVVKSLQQKNLPSLPYRVCYQSKVGYQKWLGPATEDALQEAKDKHVFLVPISFVSEHIETVVDLSLAAAQEARCVGVKSFHRILAPQTHPIFIKGLADLVKKSYTSTSLPIVHRQR